MHTDVVNACMMFYENNDFFLSAYTIIGSTEERIKTCPIPECKGQKGEAGPQVNLRGVFR